MEFVSANMFAFVFCPAFEEPCLPIGVPKSLRVNKMFYLFIKAVTGIPC